MALAPESSSTSAWLPDCGPFSSRYSASLARTGTSAPRSMRMVSSSSDAAARLGNRTTHCTTAAGCEIPVTAKCTSEPSKGTPSDECVRVRAPAISATCEVSGTAPGMSKPRARFDGPWRRLRPWVLTFCSSEGIHGMSQSGYILQERNHPGRSKQWRHERGTTPEQREAGP
jgi:hypothetical protein